MHSLLTKNIVAIFFSLIALMNYAHGQANTQVLTYSHGKYVGEVASGKANGQGTYTAAKSGTIYVGQFVNDTFSGKGTMLWTNGDKFVGIWQNDSATTGTMTFANGQTEQGIVKNAIFKSSNSVSSGSATVSGSNREDIDLVGRCLGYLASQVQNKGMQNLHSSHQKYFTSHANYSVEIQNLNKSYPSCFAPGAMIGNCLRAKGVSQSGITLVEGFNTGIQIYKQADSPTRAIIDAACMN